MDVKSLVDSSKRFAARAGRALDRHLRREQEYRERYKLFAEMTKGFSLNAPKAPLILRIEVTNLCNADCVFCTYQFQRRDIQPMEFDVFKRAVDQFTALGGQHISFTPLVGDSLIDKGLEEKVAYARQFPQYKVLELWTNAILLTRARFEALVESGINEFHISMSGFSAAEYKQLFRSSKYAKVIQNLTDIAHSEAVKKVKFMVWARTGEEDPEKAPDFIKLRDLNAFGIFFQHKMFSWHGQIKEDVLPGKMFLIKPPKDQSKPCLNLWTGFTLMSNGDMTACGCTDVDGAGLPLGNIRDHTIDAHLKDGRWHKLRDGFTSGSPPEFCKGCDMYCPVSPEPKEPLWVQRGRSPMSSRPSIT